MGRKIPSRKHHGVRDPEKQAAVRFDRIKNKINTPPTNPDNQEVPKSLQRIIDLKNKTKTGAFDKKKRKNKANIKNGDVVKNMREGQQYENTPVFEQRPNETDRQFIHRVNRICMNVTKEAEFEQKYGVEIKRNEDGEVEAVIKRPKDELEKMIKEMRMKKKEKKNKKKKVVSENVGPRLTKSQKWQKKKKEKILKKKQHKADDVENYKDNVKFGEIVHAPPTLVAPRRAEKIQSAPRPGKKNLLLKSMLPYKQDTQISQIHEKNYKTNLHKVSNQTIDKKGKRKDLPNALRRQLDNQQKEIINAYKELKARRYDKT